MGLVSRLKEIKEEAYQKKKTRLEENLQKVKARREKADVIADLKKQVAKEQEGLAKARQVGRGGGKGAGVGKKLASSRKAFKKSQLGFKLETGQINKAQYDKQMSVLSSTPPRRKSSGSKRKPKRKEIIYY
jgi:hypothetical protein